MFRFPVRIQKRLSRCKVTLSGICTCSSSMQFPKAWLPILLQSARQFEFFQSRAGKRIVSYFFQSVGKIYCAKLRLPAKAYSPICSVPAGILLEAHPAITVLSAFRVRQLPSPEKDSLFSDTVIFFSRATQSSVNPHPAFKSSAPKASSFNETQVENALSPTLVTPSGIAILPSAAHHKKHTCLCL